MTPLSMDVEQIYNAKMLWYCKRVHTEREITEFHTSSLTVFSADKTSHFVSFSKFHILGRFKR